MRTAFALARKALPKYSSKFSRHDFTLPQLFACLVVKAFLKTKTPADKLALRNSPKLKPIIERLEADKLSKLQKVDTDALLGELGTAEATTETEAA